MSDRTGKTSNNNNNNNNNNINNKQTNKNRTKQKTKQKDCESQRSKNLASRSVRQERYALPTSVRNYSPKVLEKFLFVFGCLTT